MEPRLRGCRQAPGVHSSVLGHLWLGGDISREALSGCLPPPSLPEDWGEQAGRGEVTQLGHNQDIGQLRTLLGTKNVPRRVTSQTAVTRQNERPQLSTPRPEIALGGGGGLVALTHRRGSGHPSSAVLPLSCPVPAPHPCQPSTSDGLTPHRPLVPSSVLTPRSHSPPNF